MEINIDDLQKQLEERIVALDKQRREESEKFNNEVLQRKRTAEIERSERIEQDNKKHAERKAREDAIEQEAAVRRQEEVRMRIKLESDLAGADLYKQQQQEKLQWLIKEISKQEFIEEQHAKATQSKAEKTVDVACELVNVDNPTPPVNNEHPGDAVQGTEGSTPETSCMSKHLYVILRQANRMGE